MALKTIITITVTTQLHVKHNNNEYARNRDSLTIKLLDLYYVQYMCCLEEKN